MRKSFVALVYIEVDVVVENTLKRALGERDTELQSVTRELARF